MVQKHAVSPNKPKTRALEIVSDANMYMTALQSLLLFFIGITRKSEKNQLSIYIKSVQK